MVTDMDLHSLRQFVVVAEFENIARASESLHMSASPLSRSVKKLEKEIGVQLFVRERHRLALSAAGRELLDRARDLLRHADAFERDARELAAGTLGTVVVGFVESALLAEAFTTAVQEFGVRSAGVSLDLRSLRSAQQGDAMDRGELDISVTHRRPDTTGVATKLILEEPFRLAVATNDPLAASAATVEDLMARRWIAVSSNASPVGYAEFVSKCRDAGFTPDVSCEVAEPSSALALTAAGVGVCVAQASARHPGVVLVDLPETLAGTLRIWATRASSAHSAADALYELFAEIPGTESRH